MSAMEDFQQIAQSLSRSGTRYRIEKLSLIALYVVLVATTAAWVFAGGRLLASRYAAEFRVQPLEAIESQTFHLNNVGTDPWSDVRVVLKDRYLVQLDSVEQGERVELEPIQFHDFYRVPRHWGAAEWERLTTTDRAPARAPGTISLGTDDVRIGTRGGDVDVQVIKPDGE